MVVQGPERVAIIGANGVGKTTLLEQLSGAPRGRMQSESHVAMLDTEGTADTETSAP